MSSIVKNILDKRHMNIEMLLPLRQDQLPFPELYQLVEDLKYTYLMQPQTVTGILYDVDVDGLMAGSLLFDFLKRVRGHTFQLHTFMNTGKKHGITQEVVDWVMEKRIDYLFVVDAGSGDAEQYTLLASRGVKVVILDHHPYTPPSTLPKGVWLVNPVHNKDLPLLSGAGVTYRFVEEVAKHLRLAVQMYEPLVGISVISDICSMADRENRYYVSKLYKSYADIPLLKVLADEFYTGSFITLFGYKIIPFLNALIRIGQETTAIDVVNNMFNLGKSKRAVYMQKAAIEQQKVLQDKIMQVSKLIEKPNVVILLRDTNPELSTLNGLVANKLREAYKKEALVLYVDAETLQYTGSYRGHRGSINDFFALGIEAHGHSLACGVKMTKEQLKAYANTFTPSELTSKRIADMDVQAGELTAADFMAIAQFNEMTGKDVEPIVLNLQGGFRSIKRHIQETNREILLTEKETIVQFKNNQFSDDYITFTVNLSKFAHEGYQLIRV